AGFPGGSWLLSEPGGLRTQERGLHRRLPVGPGPDPGRLVAAEPRPAPASGDKGLVASVSLRAAGRAGAGAGGPGRRPEVSDTGTGGLSLHHPRWHAADGARPLD